MVNPPSHLATGVGGYGWEQLLLPLQTSGRLLWSPCNVGPVLVRNQVLTIHDAAVIDHPEWFSTAFVLAYRTLWRLLVGSVRQLVTVSEFSRRRLADAFGLSEARIEVVPNGVSREFRPRPEEDTASTLRHLSLPDAPYFVTLSTLEPRKNLRLVLDAWARAADRLATPSNLVVIGGRGAGRIFAKGAAGAAGSNVIEVGYLPDELLPCLLSGATAMIYPSLYEGFGLPLLEAMACGAPVVTTRCGSLPEVGGAAPVYVDPNDPSLLADQLVRLGDSEDLRTELSAKSLQQAGRYTWAKSAALMDDVVERYV